MQSYILYHAVGVAESSAVAEDGAADSAEGNVNITDEEKEQRLALGEYNHIYIYMLNCNWALTRWQ
jgi:hypothetical protein